MTPVGADAVDLFWIPLGAGGRVVAWNGRLFEHISARRAHRSSLDLYHSALQIQRGPDRFTIEMGPAWGNSQRERGVKSAGPVGTGWLGHVKAFRYEVRCWRDGQIPDLAEAVDGGQRVSQDPDQAQRILELVPEFPALTWGRDEACTGDMWNSNSLTAWLLSCSGHDMSLISPPGGGRAPGWRAGCVVADRSRGRAGRDAHRAAAL